MLRTVMIPEHLMQSIETEHRLTAPAQLTTLTRLDQDMKQIMTPPSQKIKKSYCWINFCKGTKD